MISGIIKWLKDKQDNIVVPKTLAKCVFTEKGNNLQTLSSKALYLGTEGSTTQLPSVNPTMIISDLDYSIEEQLTGKRWIDGKPIYQKSFEFESGAGAQSRTIYEDKNSFLVDINSNMNNVTEAPYFKYIETDNADGITISFHQSSQYSNKKYSVTIQYTKTTDTASSPVVPPKMEAKHNYSTEEQIVGTWIDGKPIYEKTLVITSFTGGDSTVNHNIENMDVTTARVIDGYYLVFGSVPIPPNCYYNADAYTTTYIDNNTTIHLRLGNTWTCTKVVITIQYTKITD